MSKSRFLDLFFNKNLEDYCQGFFPSIISHTFPIGVISLRISFQIFFDSIQAPFVLVLDVPKTPKIDHQGYRTFVCFFVCLFLMCVLVCFCLLKGTLPALRIPPIAFISFTENVQVPFL